MSDGQTWMVEHIMGHVRHVGRVEEASRFGGVFLRLEEPQEDGSFREAHDGRQAMSALMKSRSSTGGQRAREERRDERAGSRRSR